MQNIQIVCKEYEMKRTLLSVLTVIFILTTTSCYSAITKPVKAPDIVSSLTRSDYEILGDVSISSDVHNILGIVSFGGEGYNSLLVEAKKKYPSCDAVINLYEDKGHMLVLGVYNKFHRTITGTAIHIFDGKKNYKQEVYVQD